MCCAPGADRPGMDPGLRLSPSGDAARRADFAGTGEVFDCKGSIFFNTFQKQRGTTCLTTFKFTQANRADTVETYKKSGIKVLLM